MDNVPQPPHGSSIHVAEASENRLVILIPPGSSGATGLGCFALMWNAITIPVSCVFLLVPDNKWDGGEAPPMWILIPFFSIFWAVGMGMAYAWLRSRFMQTLLAIEPGRLSVQRKLFGRKSLRQTELGPDACASLYESYQQNNVPVYGVQVRGRTRSEKLGTRLSPSEKQWLVDGINHFLGNEPEPEFQYGNQESSTLENCPDCGGELLTAAAGQVCADCGRIITTDRHSSTMLSENSTRRTSFGGRLDHITSVPALAPSDLPGDTLIRIERDEPQCLEFSYRAIPRSPALIIPAVFLTLFSMGWYSFLFFFVYMALSVDNADNVTRIFMLVFTIPFFIVGLMPAGIAMLLVRGRAVVTIDESTLQGRLRIFGPLRLTRRVSVDSITSVGLTEGNTASDVQLRHVSPMRAAAQSIGRACVVKSTEKDIPLSVSSDHAFNTQVAGLVLWQLERLGILVQNG